MVKKIGTILQRADESTEEVVFVSDADSGHIRYPVPREVYEDLGSPSHLTLVAVAGEFPGLLEEEEETSAEEKHEVDQEQGAIRGSEKAGDE